MFNVKNETCNSGWIQTSPYQFINKGHHFYIRPVSFVEDVGDCPSISAFTYHEPPLHLIAPNNSRPTLKRVFKWKHILLGVLQDQHHSNNLQKCHELFSSLQSKGCCQQARLSTTSQSDDAQWFNRQTGSTRNYTMIRPIDKRKFKHLASKSKPMDCFCSQSCSWTHEHNNSN